MKRKQKGTVAALCLVGAFILWTVAVCFIDVQAIGPDGSMVGFAVLNRLVHNFTGVCMLLYVLTDWLGLVPVGFGFAFAVLGLCQLIKRRRLNMVDRSLLTLGGFYIATMAVYLLFETVVINYRPVRIDGVLEASYPSSTTLLTMCVMPTAIMQLNSRIKPAVLRRCVGSVLGVFTGFMVVGRFFSGVHWFSDIVGGILLSTGLVLLYWAISQKE